MINVLICGINGKMGSNVYDQARAQGLNVVCGVDSSVSGAFDCPVYRTFDEVRENVDAVIDFSVTDNITSVINFVTENKCSLIEGTTGFTTAQKNAIKKCSKTVPVFMSSNMSLGINLTLKICLEAAKTLKDYDIEIVEKHHRNKIDAPSGTAIMIAEAIKEVLGEDLKIVYGRTAKRKNGEIAIHSIRGGNIVGEHEIFFIGEDEIFSVKHEAENKELYAKGAVAIAKFIVQKPAGFYTMQDYFNE